MWKQQVLRLVGRSVPLTCVAFALDDFLATAKLSDANPAESEHLAGTDLQADLDYARAVANMYLSAGPLVGRVAEIGPGGSAAVGLHLVDSGSRSIDLVDRFEFSHNPERLKQVYARIIAESPRLRELFGDAEELAPLISTHVGENAAAEIFFRDHGDYDAIVSCAVLEHLFDPIGAIHAMASALRSGGRLLHQVDLRDHGMFTLAGHHELTFLTIPSWAYRRMSRRRGRPNRVLIDRYRAALEQLGLEYRLLATHLVGVGEIEPQPYENIPEDLRNQAEAKVEGFRHRLAPEYRNLSAQDLAVSGLFISAHRP